MSVPPAVLVAQTGLLGGGERILLDWARALERPAILACPPGPLAAAAAEAGLEVAALPSRPLQRRGRTAGAARDLAALAADVARLAARTRTSVLVAAGQRPLLAAAAAPRGGAPLLGLLQDLPAGATRPALRVAAARCDAVVALSGAIARAFDPRARRLARTHVIHPGVDRGAWALPEPGTGPPRALWLGALVPWKRPDLALEIAARVPALHLDIAGAALPGDPPAFAAGLLERAARPDLAARVHLHGAVPDPRPLLAGAGALLHSADAEPFGLVLVEALAAGRPVVAPAGGGPLEIVTPSCGRLYPPGDAAGGAAALTAALADPALRAGARARAAAFDGPTAAGRFAAVVERLAR
jgi:glycosyltransferase involved in cell wall biosynthesis